MSSETLACPLSCPISWPRVRLGDITQKIGSGATPTGGQAAYQNFRSNFALVRSQNVFDRSFSEAGLAFISDEQARGLKNAQLKSKDLLLNITGDGITFGRTCMVPPAVLPACVNQHVAIIRLDAEKADPGYILSYLTHPAVKEYIESFNAGGSRRAITKAHIESFVVPLPPIDIQRKIATILATFDERIKLLKDTNNTLESICETIFKSWFVDFDPVRAKQEGHEPEGMDEATAALFPNTFQEDLVVPRGWQRGTLADVAVLNPESWTVKVHPESVQYVDLANAKENVLEQIVELPYTSAPSRARRVLRCGDTIIGTVRPGNRSFAHIYERTENLTGSTGFAVLRPKADTYTEFLYFAATQETSIEHLAHVADGGAYPAVRPEVVVKIPTVVPTKEVVEAFHSIAAPIFSKVGIDKAKVSCLVYLRDTLLPRLISGQLRLPNAEALVEEAAA